MAKVKDPVKRHGAYPNQKPIHPTDISFQTHVLAPSQVFSMQVFGRTLLYPVLKRIDHISYGMIWVDAIGDLEIFYDDNLEYLSIKNVACCALTIKFKIV